MSSRSQIAGYLLEQKPRTWRDFATWATVLVLGAAVGALLALLIGQPWFAGAQFVGTCVLGIFLAHVVMGGVVSVSRRRRRLRDEGVT
jgi:uncharacterized membrane protein YfcA